MYYLKNVLSLHFP